MKNISILLVFALLNVSCSNLERLDTSQIKEEMEGYKVKRVTPTQITYQVEKIGLEISQALTLDFEKQMKGMSKTRSEEICQLQNINLIDSLSKTYDLKIRLLGQPDIGSNNSLYAKEKEVLEAYADNVSKKLSLSDNIQKIGDSLFIYTSPIPANKGVGKLCFSDDTGFAIWSIVMKKSAVVKSIKSPLTPNGGTKK